jgi:hypothetical protein
MSKMEQRPKGGVAVNDACVASGTGEYCYLYREFVMKSFLHDENIALYRKLIEESEGNPSRDEDRHAMLLTLLAEEEAKANNPTISACLTQDEPRRYA